MIAEVYRAGILLPILFLGLFCTSVFAQVPESQPVSEIAPYETDVVPGGSDILGDFVVGPGKVDLTISPGETKVVYMTVTNRTGERRTFTIAKEDAQGSQSVDTPIVLLGDDTGPYSIRDFISFPHSTFELNHSERARIPVTISIPGDAEPGGLYGSVLVNTVAVEAQEGNTGGTAPQSAIVARIGTLFFITVPGDVVRDAKLSEFGTIGNKKFFQRGPIEFGILHENTGTMHIAPSGELKITNSLGNEVGYVSLDPWFVLPESIRLREVTWNREFLMGRYTATVSINRGYDGHVDEASFVFWVLPWRETGALALVSFVALFLIRTFFKKFEFRRREEV